MLTKNTVWLILCISLFLSCGYSQNVQAEEDPVAVQSREDSSEKSNSSTLDGYILTNRIVIGRDDKGNRIIERTYIKDNQSITITEIPYIKLEGQIFVVGNEPFSMVTMRTKDGSFYFRPGTGDPFRKRQAKTLIIEARVEKRTTANTKTGRTLSRNWIYPLTESD